MLNKLNIIDNKTNEILNKIIAYSDKILSGNRLLVRQQENELGNFTANACKHITNANLCVINGGSIRASLPSGNITYKDILAIFPFQNKIGTYKITGKQIKDMFEHSIEFIPDSFGGFLSVSSNVKIIYNSNNVPKQRIKEIYINNELLDINKTYTIAMPSFLAAGGDDYIMLKNIILINEFDTIENLVIKYINEYSIQEKDYQLGRLINID